MKTTSSITALLISLSVGAQPVLTQTLNEPQPGDILTMSSFDSTAQIPRSTGSGQYWDFSAITPPSFQPAVLSLTYTAASGVPSSSLFPGSTMCEGPSYYKNFYKSVSSPSAQLEHLGTIAYSSTKLMFTDPKVIARWPMQFGDMFTDTYAGTRDYGTQTYTFSGTITVEASGTGTLALPGGISFNNVLQVRTLESVPMPGQFSIANSPERYSYFIGGVKEPLVSVIRQDIFGNDTIHVLWNEQVVSAIQQQSASQIEVFPIPAKDQLNLQFNGPAKSGTQIHLSDAAGRRVTSIAVQPGAFTAKLDVKALPPGIYLLQQETQGVVRSRNVIIQ